MKNGLQEGKNVTWFYYDGLKNERRKSIHLGDFKDIVGNKSTQRCTEVQRGRIRTRKTKGKDEA